MDESAQGRRDILAAGASALCFALPNAPAQAKIVPTDAGADRLRTFMLLRGALDSQLVIGCSKGVYYGVMNGEATAYYGYVSATFARYRPSAAGGYEGATYEVAYFTDLDTDAILESWKNPLTGEKVPVPQTSMPPARIRFTPDLAMQLPGGPPGLTIAHTVSPATILGDDLWIVERSSIAIQAPHMAKPVHFSEIVTLQGRVADLRNPHAKRVACLVSYQGIGGWRAWQKMGDRPGSLCGGGYGRYGITLTQLPPNWLRITRERRPELLRDPGAALAPLMAL